MRRSTTVRKRGAPTSWEAEGNHPTPVRKRFRRGKEEEEEKDTRRGGGGKRGRGEGSQAATLPAKIIPFENHDKIFHERWYPTRDWLDIPHPFRLLLAAKPNGGKTTVILNIILRVACGKTPFEKIVVVHCDPTDTKEYQNVEHELRSDVPRPEEFDPQQKTLCILEDLNYIGMGKEQRGDLERLVGYASTHKNVSVMLTAQDPFRIPPTVRRCMNVFVLWNHHDGDMLRTLARKTGKSEEVLEKVLRTHCQDPHDSVWIDRTPDSPAPFRKNGYERIATTRATNFETRAHRRGRDPRPPPPPKKPPAPPPPPPTPSSSARSRPYPLPRRRHPSTSSSPP